MEKVVLLWVIGYSFFGNIVSFIVCNTNIVSLWVWMKLSVIGYYIIMIVKMKFFYDYGANCCYQLLCRL